MSRHRSPSGRHAHPRRSPPEVPGARPRTTHAAPHARAAVRNGLTAAAVTGGTLALVSPAVAIVGGPADAGDATVLRLAAEEAAAAEAVAGDEGTGVRMLATIVPVAQTVAAEPPTADAAELLKAVDLAEIARKAEEARAAREAQARCDADLGGLGRVKPWVRDAARFLACLYEQPDLIGVASRARASDHPTGHAVDLMVRGERGDRIAECALANQDEFGISYVIWKQRVNYGDGWEGMSDRGGDTANHYDHVHISFEKRAPGGDPTVEPCG